MTYRSICAILYLLILCREDILAQYNNYLKDGRRSDATCESRQFMINSRPKEVQFGIQIHSNGDVFFSMNSVGWFRNLFTPGMGISADIVSRDRYTCDSFQPGDGLFRGYVLPPVMQQDFSWHMVTMEEGNIVMKIGTLPEAMRKKDLEGNLVVVVQDKVCYYTNFFDIPRDVWDILPMGLYVDTLEHLAMPADSGMNARWGYEHVVQVAVPFGKNKDVYTGTEVKRIYDSLHLESSMIRKLDIRAYSSVEGPESVNGQLMKGRANAMVAAMRKLQPNLSRVHILTAENWLDFYRQIKGSDLGYLAQLTRSEVKARLLDKAVADPLEPILARERMAILTIYYGKKTGWETSPKEGLPVAFNKAIAEKKIGTARMIQKEIYERIADNQAPMSYLDRLEVPQEKVFWEVLGDRTIYSYQLGITLESEALQELLGLSRLDPGNGRINYNICALSLYSWQSGDSTAAKGLPDWINQLQRQGIESSLVKRMLVNYHILRSFDLLNASQYAEKDKSVQFIKENYEGLALTDEDRFSLAKYFAFYSVDQWAEEIVVKRIDQLNVSEDLVFYYVNLLFFQPKRYGEEAFSKAMINAFTLDRVRFCHFFDPTGTGGVGVQLLEEARFRQLYCEKCRAVR